MTLITTASVSKHAIKVYELTDGFKAVCKCGYKSRAYIQHVTAENDGQRHVDTEKQSLGFKS